MEGRRSSGHANALAIQRLATMHDRKCAWLLSHAASVGCLFLRPIEEMLPVELADSLKSYLTPELTITSVRTGTSGFPPDEPARTSVCKIAVQARGEPGTHGCCHVTRCKGVTKTFMPSRHEAREQSKLPLGRRCMHLALKNLRRSSARLVLSCRPSPVPGREGVEEATHLSYLYYLSA